MGDVKKRKAMIMRVALVFLIGVVAVSYKLLYIPKDSLELYQSIGFADQYEDVLKLMLDGYEENFPRETYESIRNKGYGPQEIQQFTLFRYVDTTFLVMTTPGGNRLKVMKVEELPEEVRDYFLGIAP
ncbi:hypothetical protein GCM10008967_32500 [Bacillus carboniphilus]|uniref:DUF3139 domain-containing protein n=1 Tax=Bacillus carboniphilus TaxID=86663 RepID=A0ABP3G968_9BACI